MLEDATLHGYGLASGLPGREGTKFVASKLAKFHAASLYLDQDVSLWKFFVKSNFKLFFNFFLCNCCCSLTKKKLFPMSPNKVEQRRRKKFNLLAPPKKCSKYVNFNFPLFKGDRGDEEKKVGQLRQTGVSLGYCNEFVTLLGGLTVSGETIASSMEEMNFVADFRDKVRLQDFCGLHRAMLMLSGAQPSFVFTNHSVK